MQCPICGSDRNPEHKTCPTCGVNFSKWLNKVISRLNKKINAVMNKGLQAQALQTKTLQTKPLKSEPTHYKEVIKLD